MRYLAFFKNYYLVCLGSSLLCCWPVLIWYVLPVSLIHLANLLCYCHCSYDATALLKSFDVAKQIERLDLPDVRALGPPKHRQQVTVPLELDYLN